MTLPLRPRLRRFILDRREGGGRADLRLVLLLLLWLLLSLFVLFIEHDTRLSAGSITPSEPYDRVWGLQRCCK